MDFGNAIRYVEGELLPKLRSAFVDRGTIDTFAVVLSADGRRSTVMNDVPSLLKAITRKMYARADSVGVVFVHKDGANVIVQLEYGSSDFVWYARYNRRSLGEWTASEPGACPLDISTTRFAQARWMN